jgi:hypothetical protein
VSWLKIPLVSTRLLSIVPKAHSITGDAALPGLEGVRSNGRTSPEPRDAPVRDLFKSRDAPSSFGSSYIGPQAAAKIIEAPAPDFSSGMRHAAASTYSFCDVGGPFSQIWDLLGLLPRHKASVDRLVDVFLRELNWTIDAVHSASFKAKYDHF